MAVVVVQRHSPRSVSGLWILSRDEAEGAGSSEVLEVLPGLEVGSPAGPPQLRLASLAGGRRLAPCWTLKPASCEEAHTHVGRLGRGPPGAGSPQTIRGDKKRTLWS